MNIDFDGAAAYPTTCAVGEVPPVRPGRVPCRRRGQDPSARRPGRRPAPAMLPIRRPARRATTSAGRPRQAGPPRQALLLRTPGSGSRLRQRRLGPLTGTPAASTGARTDPAVEEPPVRSSRSGSTSAAKPSTPPAAAKGTRHGQLVGYRRRDGLMTTSQLIAGRWVLPTVESNQDGTVRMHVSVSVDSADALADIPVEVEPVRRRPAAGPRGGAVLVVPPRDPRHHRGVRPGFRQPCWRRPRRLHGDDAGSRPPSR